MAEISESTLETLRQLQEQEQEKTRVESQRDSSRWRNLFRLNGDNLILFIMFAILIVLAVGMMWLVKDSSKKAKEQRAENARLADTYRRSKTHEVSLGESETRSTTAAAGGVSVMTYETVLTLDGAEHSYAQANGLVERKKNRIRQEVDKILFSATGQELAEPSLSSVRDRIKSQINDLLDNEEVLQVDFAEFRKYEMPHTQEND